ncbi:uncharacterized protein LOC114164025 isoform X2 [Vigna unguiculata]|nr:uncharacterized protein LOC114164025 isoform X2 [Vigna unguiculata]XP_027904286.1 uncharacterized protein LOC114164025 isoform X2 [Vigna unguiculata]XP_027904287.1 uncharacterized protein LOC114164025 isoform X2 [Vigna unguiculata]
MVRTRGRHGKLVRRDQRKRGVPISMHGDLAVELGNISYGNVLSRHTASSGQHPPHLPHSSIPSSSTPSPSTPSSSTPSPPTSSSNTPSQLTPSSSTPSFSTDQRHVFQSSLRSMPLPHHTSTSVLHHTTYPPLHPTTYPPLHPNFPQTVPPVLPSSAPKVHDTRRTIVQSFSPTVHFPFHPLVQVPSTPLGQTSFALPVEPPHDDVVQHTPATSNHHVLPEEVPRDASGRVIIRPVGKGWTPNRYAVEAIGHAIRSQFGGPYHHYEAMPEDAQLKWWTKFKARVTWAPQDEWQIRKVYESKVRKRLSDMLTKARVRGNKPSWIGEQAWSALLNYWDSEKFKERSSRNKINRSSARGGALHSTGRKSHLDIALALERKYGRPVEPDELFLATHTKKNGGWVDGRARETYETYHERLRVIQAESFERSTSDPKQISAVIKIQCWKDVAGGKSKGRVYGTADLAANIRHGVSSLTQPSLLAAATNHIDLSATDHIDYSAENEQLRRQVTQANITAREAMEKCAKLEDTMQLLKQQMAMMMERRVEDMSTSIT